MCVWVLLLHLCTETLISLLLHPSFYAPLFVLMPCAKESLCIVFASPVSRKRKRERERSRQFSCKSIPAFYFNGHGHLSTHFSFSSSAYFAILSLSLSRSLNFCSCRPTTFFACVALYNSQSVSVCVGFVLRADRVSSSSLSLALRLRYLKSKLRMRGCHSMPYY